LKILEKSEDIKERTLKIAKLEMERICNDNHLIKDFTILEEIGKGGQSILFKARQDLTGKIYACKKSTFKNEQSVDSLIGFL
jgi:hypothetical protein